MTDLPGIAIGLGLYYGLKKVADAWVDIVQCQAAAAKLQAAALDAAANRIATAIESRPRDARPQTPQH